MASAVYESEVAFISGVAENGTVVGNSFATMNTRATASHPVGGDEVGQWNAGYGRRRHLLLHHGLRLDGQREGGLARRPRPVVCGGRYQVR